MRYPGLVVEASHVVPMHQYVRMVTLVIEILNDQVKIIDNLYFCTYFLFPDACFKCECFQFLCILGNEIEMNCFRSTRRS